MTIFDEVPETLTIEDVSEILAVLPITVQAFVDDHEITGRLIGDELVFDREEIKRFDQKRQQERFESFERLREIEEKLQLG